MPSDHTTHWPPSFLACLPLHLELVPSHSVYQLQRQTLAGPSTQAVSQVQLCAHPSAPHKGDTG